MEHDDVVELYQELDRGKKLNFYIGNAQDTLDWVVDFFAF